MQVPSGVCPSGSDAFEQPLENACKASDAIVVHELASSCREISLSHVFEQKVPASEAGGPLSRALRDTAQARARPVRVVGDSSSSKRSSDLAMCSLLRGKK